MNVKTFMMIYYLAVCLSAQPGMAEEDPYQTDLEKIDSAKIARAIRCDNSAEPILADYVDMITISALDVEVMWNSLLFTIGFPFAAGEATSLIGTRDEIMHSMSKPGQHAAIATLLDEDWLDDDCQRR